MEIRLHGDLDGMVPRFPYVATALQFDSVRHQRMCVFDTQTPEEERPDVCLGKLSAFLPEDLDQSRNSIVFFFRT